MRQTNLITLYCAVCDNSTLTSGSPQTTCSASWKKRSGLFRRLCLPPAQRLYHSNGAVHLPYPARLSLCGTGTGHPPRQRAQTVPLMRRLVPPQAGGPGDLLRAYCSKRDREDLPGDWSAGGLREKAPGRGLLEALQASL